MVPPLERFLYALRPLLYRPFFGKMGKGVSLADHIRFARLKNIFLGDNIFINFYSGLFASDSTITIGNCVMIGPYTRIFTQNHRYDDPDTPMFQQGYDSKPVIIEDDVWIGANCTILPGVRIGKGSVIGAGAVVTKDIPAFSVAGGVPAKVIKKRT